MLHDVPDDQNEAFPNDEKRYLNLLDNLRDGFFEINAQGCFTSANRALSRIHGFDSPSELLGRCFLDFVAPGMKNDVEREFRQAIVTGTPPKIKEVLLVRGNGKEVYAEVKPSLVLQPDGAIIAKGILRDITDCKQAEEVLRNDKERLTLAIEVLGAGVWEMNLITDQIWWDERFPTLYGLTGDTLPGKLEDRFRLLHPDDQHRAREELSAAIDGADRYESVFRVIWPDSGIHSIRDCGRIYRDSDGQAVRLVGVSLDVTDVKRAERKYRSMFDNALEGIFQATPEGKFLDVNPTLARMCGFENPKEMVTTITDIATQLYADPVDRDRIKALYEKNGIVENFETQFRRKDGKTIWVSVDSRAVMEGKRNILYYEGMIEDITERKRIEEEKERLKIQLAQAEKMEAIGTLAGGIAHDFNNILGIIMGYTELAMLGLGEELPVKSKLDEVLKATHRAKDLVAQILTFSHKTKQERKPLSLVPLIKEVLKLLRASLPATIEIRQQINLPRESGMVLADPTQVHQILMNLATNAFHAMQEKGGILQVSLSSVYGDLLAEDESIQLRAEKYFKLGVEDTGHGIDGAIIDRIFDPYFTTKKLGEGTGLGLAVVHGIVKSYGGAIAVHSKPGKGSVFHVYLPEWERDGETGKDQVPIPAPGGMERVLLVDDEEALMEVVRQMLEHLGYKVTARTDSTEALSLFRQEPDGFDLVITDYTMPKMTGADLAQEIMQIRPDIPVILSTGFNERISEETARKMGIHALIMKPISLGQIANVIHRIFSAG